MRRLLQFLLTSLFVYGCSDSATTNSGWSEVKIGNHITKIFADSSSIWIITRKPEILQYENGLKSWSQNDLPAGLLSDADNVTSGCIDSSGHVWFTSLTGIIEKIDNQWKLFNSQNTPEFKSNAFTDVCCDKFGNVWVLSSGGFSTPAVYKYDGQQWVTYDKANTGNGFAATFVSKIISDLTGNIWVVGDSGILKYSNNIWTTAPFAKTLSVNDMVCDNLNNICLATDSGLMIFNGNSITKYTKQTNSNLVADTINCLAVDNSNNIWLGFILQKNKSSDLIATVKFTANGFQQISPYGIQFGHSVTSIVVDANNELWFGFGDTETLAHYSQYH